MLKKREREKLIFEINVTPLTDVMLVLLIIFMVTTPFIIQGNIKINLPSAKAPADESINKDIVIGITRQGRVYVNGKEALSDQQIFDMIKRAVETSGKGRVIIEGDKLAIHGSVVRIMSIARDAGAEKLAITTIPEESMESVIK